MIRPASFHAAAVCGLAIPVIEAPFGTLSVMAIGLAALQTAPFLTAQMTPMFAKQSPPWK